MNNEKCSHTEVVATDVKFRDGSVHTQQSCKDCGRHIKFGKIPKTQPEIQEFHTPETIQEEKELDAQVNSLYHPESFGSPERIDTLEDGRKVMVPAWGLKTLTDRQIATVLARHILKRHLKNKPTQSAKLKSAE